MLKKNQKKGKRDSKRWKLIATCLFIMLLINQVVTPIQSYSKQTNSIVYPTSATQDDYVNGIESLTKESVESFADSFMADKMKEYEIPGAAIAVVKDGNILYEKAYGYKDRASKEPFTTDTTTFRIASVTKIFTMTALMQLVEQGKVNLDEDITTYLPGIELENPYDKNPTVRDLLTHTSGIDSSVVGDLSHDKIDVDQPHYLMNEMGKKHLVITSEPGKHIAYCSYGSVLAGCIVEEVSGVSCKKYIEDNILQPLGMTHTVMGLEDNNLSKGYISTGKGIEEEELTGDFRLYPEGGMISSLEDMTKFILSYLPNESNATERQQGSTLPILEPNTIREIETTQIRFSQVLPGECLGFAEYEAAGKRVIGHAGYSPDGFCSQIDLYPNEGVGTFLIVNQGSNNYIADEFRDAFVSRYMVSRGETANDFLEPTVDDSQSIKQRYTTKDVEGTYRFSDYSKTTLCKGDIFGGMTEVKIERVNDTTILVNGMDEYTQKSYSKRAVTEDGLSYQIEGTSNYLVFEPGHEGITYMAMSKDSSHGYYERLKWYETANVQLPIFLVAMVTFLLTIIVIVARVIRNAIRSKKVGKNVKKAILPGVKESIMALIAFLNIGFYGYSMFFWETRLHYDVPIDIKINLCMPIVSTILTVSLIPVIFNQLMKKEKKLVVRLIDSFFLVMAIVFIGFFYYWNFLGFHY